MVTAPVRVLGLLVAGLVVGAMVTMAMRDVPTASTGSVDIDAVLAYLEEVEPLAQEGGRVVQHGMKRGVAELQKPDGDHEEQARLAPSWVSSMTDLRERWGLVAVPPAMAQAHAGFLEAWDLYREAGEALAAAAADETRRAELVVRAIELGERGDDVWDAAGLLAQELVVGAGEEPLAWLPELASD